MLRLAFAFRVAEGRVRRGKPAKARKALNRSQKAVFSGASAFRVFGDRREQATGGAWLCCACMRLFRSRSQTRRGHDRQRVLIGRRSAALSVCVNRIGVLSLCSRSRLSRCRSLSPSLFPVLCPSAWGAQGRADACGRGASKRSGGRRLAAADARAYECVITAVLFGKPNANAHD